MSTFFSCWWRCDRTAKNFVERSLDAMWDTLKALVKRSKRGLKAMLCSGERCEKKSPMSRFSNEARTDFQHHT